jgi:hypothetical protein
MLAFTRSYVPEEYRKLYHNHPSLGAAGQGEKQGSRIGEKREGLSRFSPQATGLRQPR